MLHLIPLTTALTRSRLKPFLIKKTTSLSVPNTTGESSHFETFFYAKPCLLRVDLSARFDELFGPQIWQLDCF
jgi:hypothetical protein